MLILFFLKNSCKNDLKIETIEEIVNMLIRGIQMLESELKKALADKLPNELRVQYLDTLKVLTFLIVEFSTILEKKFVDSRNSELVPQARRGGGGGAGGKKGAAAAAKKTQAANNLEISQSSLNFDWVELREKVLDALSKLVVLNIQKLWDPPIAEEQFVM